MTRTVVHLIGSLDRGGAEMVALDLCRRIPADEIRQVFVCLSGRAGALAREFEFEGAIIELAGIDSPMGAARATRNAIRKHRPEAVVSHVSLASGLLLTIARMHHVPIRIARLHSGGDGQNDRLYRRVYRTVSRALLVTGATRIVAVSLASLQFGVGRWAPMLSSRASVLGNGVDTARFAPSDAPPRHRESRVIHVGRGSPEKNRSSLGGIYRALENVMPSRWWIVGPGGCADLGVIPDEGFEVLGDRHDVAALLRESDVLVLPSLREGLPGVILEALSTGVPVVASDLPTLRELATKLPGVSLVSLDATPEAWATAIAAMLGGHHPGSPTIRSALLESEFTLERSVDAWRRLLEPN